MTAAIDTVLEVDTPEHLAFKTRIGGPGRRMFAWTIDLIVRAVLLMIVWLTFNVVFGSVALDGVASGLVSIAVFILDWFYFVISEHLTGGRSIGKIALKLRVVRTNGLPITWRESALRNLVRAGDLAIFPPKFFLAIGPLVMAFDAKFRRLGDFVAGTIVVVEDTTAVGNRTALVADEELTAELPSSLPLGRDDLEALELFVSRDHVSDARRAELAEIVAPIYAAQLSMPRPQDPTKFLAALWARAQDPKRSRMIA